VLNALAIGGKLGPKAAFGSPKILFVSLIKRNLGIIAQAEVSATVGPLSAFGITR
jgi:hypothetical protein